VSYVLYWRPGAAAMAPHAALAEIGADYRLVEIVPTLVDEESGHVLTESAAILLYLGDRFPASQLAPADRADYYRWLVFLTNTVQTAFLRFFYPERYGGADDVADAGSRDAGEAFDIVERALEGRTWLAAEHRTGVDLFLFMVTRWGRRLEHPAWDRPNIRRHALASLELPGVQRMLDEQGLEIPSL